MKEETKELIIEVKEEAKGELKDLAEQISVQTVYAFFRMIEILITKTPNKFDDMLLPLLDKLKALILKAVDRINDEFDLGIKDENA